MPSENRLELLTQPGFGSAIIEAQLALYGVPFISTPVGDLFTDPEARRHVAQYNPLGQLPTLLVNDSLVLTESAAITLWLADEYGTERLTLVPDPGDPVRPLFLRWLIYWVASPYAVYACLDHGAALVSDASAREKLERSLRQRLGEMILNLAAAAQTPWFLGDRLSALDIYAAVFTEWTTPGRNWYAEHAPGLLDIAGRVWALPALAPVHLRNFGRT